MPPDMTAIAAQPAGKSRRDVALGHPRNMARQDIENNSLPCQIAGKVLAWKQSGLHSPWLAIIVGSSATSIEVCSGSVAAAVRFAGICIQRSTNGRGEARLFSLPDSATRSTCDEPS